MSCSVLCIVQFLPWPDENVASSQNIQQGTGLWSDFHKLVGDGQKMAATETKPGNIFVYCDVAMSVRADS